MLNSKKVLILSIILAFLMMGAVSAAEDSDFIQSPDLDADTVSLNDVEDTPTLSAGGGEVKFM